MAIMQSVRKRRRSNAGDAGGRKLKRRSNREPARVHSGKPTTRRGIVSWRYLHFRKLRPKALVLWALSSRHEHGKIGLSLSRHPKRFLSCEDLREMHARSNRPRGSRGIRRNDSARKRE